MKTFFDVENLRNVLSRKRNLSLFRKTYFDKLPEIKDENTADFWNNRSTRSKRLFLNSPIYRDKINILYNFLRNKKGKVLDIGFGKGTLEEKITSNKHQLEIYGIDISKKAVGEIKRKINGKFCVANVLKIPFKSLFFDFIIILDVLEHIPPSKTFRTYKEINRVLAKGGILLVSVPLNEGLENLLREGKNPNEHVRAYTSEILKAELKLSGFTVLKEFYLYAFSDFYLLKKLIMRIFPRLKKPNLLILFAKK